jgi:acetoin utilization deacetylase AcuC-like enzyme
MKLWSHDRYRFPLPEHHRWPRDKYPLLRARMEAEGHEVLEAEAIPWELVTRVQDPGLVTRIRDGALTLREQRGLGLPWSPELVERARRTTAGTLAAARHARAHRVAINLGGGTHHAGRDFARGYCLFNDVAVAIAALREEGALASALVVDCDVHQGDGTAQIFADDPSTFTVSLHGARNYPFERIPSDLDVDLPSGTRDADYLRALHDALDRVPAFDAAFYLAGADPWEGDRLGRLALTKGGLRRRDELVLDRLLASGAAVCVVLAGGYADDIEDTVDINAATVRTVAERASA